tara:strand:+ start:285 stop:884 length:600 start_codon:yes stop_codon:yes gene_type:complete
VPKKDTDQLIRKLRKAGIPVNKRNNGHWAVECPDGSTYWMSSTPSCRFAIKKQKAGLVKRGVPIELLFFDVLELMPEWGFPYVWTLTEMDQILESDEEAWSWVDEGSYAFDQEIAEEFKLLPPVGSLVRGLVKPEANQPSVYKGTPPFIVLEWRSLGFYESYEEDQETPKVWLVAKTLFKGSVVWVPMMSWFFELEQLS